MKHIITILVVLLVSINVNAQEKKLSKKEKVTTVVSYYENGEVKETGEFDDNGKLSGTWMHYNETGDLIVKGNYVNGKRQGKWLYWRQNGLKEFMYKDHKIVDVTTWSKDVAVNK